MFYEFDWKDHREIALVGEGDGDPDGDVWNVLVADDSKKSKGKKTAVGRPKKIIKKEVESDEEIEESESGASEDEYENQSDDEDEEEEGPSDSETPSPDETDDGDDYSRVPRTPSKKRKRSTVTRTPSKRTPASKVTTPRKPNKRRTVIAPTPHSRKSLAARKQKQTLRVRPPPPLTSHLQLENLPTDPWLRAMHVLHVGARPDVLPCREEEYARCLRAVEELLEEGSGGCVCEFFFPSFYRAAF